MYYLKMGGMLAQSIGCRCYGDAGPERHLECCQHVPRQELRLSPLLYPKHRITEGAKAKYRGHTHSRQCACPIFLSVLPSSAPFHSAHCQHVNLSSFP